MSKELTEQWKNGTLKEGWYYLGIVPSKKCIDYYYGKDFVRYNEWAITKVIAPVPTYDEYKKLKGSEDAAFAWRSIAKEIGKERDELVTKCNRLEKRNAELVTKCHRLESKLSCISEQLKEANEVIKYYANSFFGDKQEDGTYLICTRENACGRVEVTYNPNIANNYLEKWGVK